MTTEYRVVFVADAEITAGPSFEAAQAEKQQEETPQGEAPDTTKEEETSR